MGRGDKKSKKGKRTQGSFGKSRMRKSKLEKKVPVLVVAEVEKPKATPKPKSAPKEKAVPVVAEKVEKIKAETKAAPTAKAAPKAKAKLKE